MFQNHPGRRRSFPLSNSGAIITDAFPENERGKALGINQLSFLAGSLIGLVLGGVLAVYRLALGLPCQRSSRRNRHHLVILETKRTTHRTQKTETRHLG